MKRSSLATILYIFVSLVFFMPGLVRATTVGFVPSTGVWFSKSEFSPQEKVWIYTVVVNNEFPELSGIVSFYDNNEIIDTAEVKALRRDEARQLKILWQPEEGNHNISARFTKATVVDEAGKRKEIEVSGITSVAGAPLLVGSSVIAPKSPQTLGDAQAQLAQVSDEKQKLIEDIGMTRVAVVKTGTNYSLAAQTGGQTAGGMTVDQVIAKNKEILSKAEQVAGTITSTAGRLNSAYVQTKSVVEKGQEWYGGAKSAWQKIVPYLEKARPYWNVVSNNNDPKRIGLIVGALIIMYWLTKKMLRRQEYYDDLEM